MVSLCYTKSGLRFDCACVVPLQTHSSYTHSLANKKGRHGICRPDIFAPAVSVTLSRIVDLFVPVPTSHCLSPSMP